MFGYSEHKLIGMKLRSLLDIPSSDKTTTTSDDDTAAINQSKNQDILIELDRLDENGRVVLCSGKIFDAITVDNTAGDDTEKSNMSQHQQHQHLIIPISMYMLKLTDEQEPKCLCVMEPVQRVVGNFTINLKVKKKTSVN